MVNIDTIIPGWKLVLSQISQRDASSLNIGSICPGQILAQFIYGTS